MPPIITVIMPTYNSQNTIELSLQSLQKQTLPKESIELLVIDGGSTDNTIAIAQKYGATILQNPDRVPEKAKYIGLQNAKGKYIVKMDSDEVFVSDKQLETRLELLAESENLQCIIIDYLATPAFDKKNIARAYLNIYGDPFSAFIYHNKGTLLKTFQKNILKKYDSDKYVLAFSTEDVKPLGDGGTTMLSLEYAKQVMPEKVKEESFAASGCQDIILATGLCGCIDHDIVLHYSKADIKSYLKKLRFRVLNNLYATKDSGYANVSQQNKSLKRRKYLFMLYTISIILPILDSIRLSFRHKDATMLLHFFYLYVVVFYLVYFGFRKVLGFSDENKEY